MKILFNNTFITDNSKECQENCLWLECEQNVKFKDEALKNGAKIISLNECKKLLNINENIKIIGITGTNGKTTTAALIHHLFNFLGFKSALCGTRGAFIDKEQIGEKGLTTASILQTLHYLALASKAGCEFFIMEVSSHALVQKRIQSLEFVAKIFTNLSQDHLDFHKDFKAYQEAKESFFTDESLKFINIDGIKIAYNKANAFTYGVTNKADYSVSEYSLQNGIKAKLCLKDKNITINSPLQGLFNLYNLLSALACVNELVCVDESSLQKAVSKFQGVSGRVEEVANGVIVDFAHTPDGIEKVLEALSYKKLIVVFGAGGDRDKTKRPLMAKAAKKFAQKLIITSDNPRSEEPKAIIKDILSGISQDESVIVEEDRKKAIQKALKFKQNDEFVVILGKGDENYQEIKGVKHPFSDKEIVKEILKENHSNL